jgi:tRNA dimethylallyltransferase
MTHDPTRGVAATPPAPDAPPLRWLGLAGPTASGKTAAALDLARTHRVEIISVDSALVYRGMDIGTAKPDAAERAQAPHHLIDLIDPRESYSAARFVEDATRLIDAVRARGALPLLVGGTMLYFKALLDGLDPMPAADPALRARLEARAAQEGWAALHAELARVDPATAARLPPGDTQRIQRALEVWMVSGRPMSAWHRTDGTTVPSEAAVPPPGIRLFSLEPRRREWLHRRVDARFDAMLRAGLVEEVMALRARGDLDASLPSMRCVGYRQTWEMLDGDFPLAGLAERGSAATRQLAKRQLTWLRGMPWREVIEADGPDPLGALRAALGTALDPWRR